jgi:hypothetical protein
MMSNVTPGRLKTGPAFLTYSLPIFMSLNIIFCSLPELKRFGNEFRTFWVDVSVIRSRNQRRHAELRKTPQGYLWRRSLPKLFL